MSWSLAFPNLLIGLREGLEAGLVVTILMGSVRRLAPDRSLAGVWLGVTAATITSLCFGAVLTFTRAELSPQTQEVFGGLTSLAAVALVTTMIFWMRTAARGLAGDLRSRVSEALIAGGPALVVTAFVAVAREGLEAALFVWTNAQAAGSSASPLLGALIGLLIAVALCVGLHRRVLRLNLARFFTVTGAVLVVIVAGVLAYGTTDLQDAGILPGANSIAFDVADQVPTGQWWSETIRGITNLNNRMSWLAVIAYLTYVATVMSLFLRRARPNNPLVQPAATPDPSGARPLQAWPARADRGQDRRPLASSVVIAAVPVLVATTWVALDHHRAGRADGEPTVTITDSNCAADWLQPAAGNTIYSVRNQSTHAVDVELVTSPGQAVVAEIEVLGPGTARALPATLADGLHQWKCIYAGAATGVSALRAPATSANATIRPAPLKPATAAELAPALVRYRAYVGEQLALLATQVADLNQSVLAGIRAYAEQNWITAYLTYHRIGAAYGAFGAAGTAVDGLASGLPEETADPDFVGFHRIEFGLWSAQPLAALTAPTRALVAAVAVLNRRLASFTFDPNDVTVRAHEIVEDTIRFVLTSQSDYGCGCGYATAQADLAGDQVLVDLLATPLTGRDPSAIPTVHRDAAALQGALTLAIGQHTSVAATPLTTRQTVNAATSQLAEDLAPIPDLLEVKRQ